MGEGGGSVIAVCGLAREAALAAGPGVQAFAAGGARLAALIEGAIGGGAAAIISFGIAGGLDPALPPGAVILARSIISGGQRWAVDDAWRQRMAATLPEALAGDIAGVEWPVLAVAGKQALRRATGALAVDMESHVAARLAAAAGLPLAALRVVCDPALRVIPACAVAGMRDDGGTDVGAVLRGLLARPADLPGIIRLALDARAAFAALARCRRDAGVGFRFPELGEAC